VVASHTVELDFQTANLIGTDTQVASEESSHKDVNNARKAKHLLSLVKKEKIRVEDATCEQKQPVADLVEATEWIDIVTQDAIEAGMTHDEGTHIAEFGDTNNELVNTAEHRRRCRIC
jgi:hypothetical protein